MIIQSRRKGQPDNYCFPCCNYSIGKKSSIQEIMLKLVSAYYPYIRNYIQGIK